MTTEKTDPIKLAKQGNCKAITFLINRLLKGQGISSQAILKENCLQIMLDGNPLPDSDKVVNLVYEKVSTLSISNLKSLKVYGRQVGNKSPDWVKKYTFTQESISNSPPDEVLEEKQGSISESILAHNKKEASIEEPFMLECPGQGGSLVVTNKEVIFRRNGGFLSPYKKGEKSILYDDIAGILYQKPQNISPGYLYIQVLGDPSSITYLAASSHENAIVFISTSSQVFDQAYEYLMERVFCDDQNQNFKSSEQDIDPKNNDADFQNLDLSKSHNSITESEIESDDLIFKGDSGLLILTDRGVTLKRVGGLFRVHPEGEKHILYRNITAVQLKPANFTLGFIQFSFQGGRESLGTAFNAISDENTITFATKEKTQEFTRAKEIIEQRIHEAAEPRPQASGGSDLDQLEKLASLRDKGIITEDEFQAKKRQILGL